RTREEGRKRSARCRERQAGRCSGRHGSSHGQPRFADFCGACVVALARTQSHVGAHRRWNRMADGVLRNLGITPEPSPLERPFHHGGTEITEKNEIRRIKPETSATVLYFGGLNSSTTNLIRVSEELVMRWFSLAGIHTGSPASYCWLWPAPIFIFVVEIGTTSSGPSLPRLAGVVLPGSRDTSATAKFCES